MIFEQVATGGCQSYLVGCPDTTRPDPTLRVLTICEYGRISTLAAATLQQMGFQRAIALDGGMKGWREACYPLTTGAEP